MDAATHTKWRPLVATDRGARLMFLQHATSLLNGPELTSKSIIRRGKVTMKRDVIHLVYLTTPAHGARRVGRACFIERSKTSALQAHWQ